MKKSYLYALIFVFVYLAAVYLWSFPFHENKLPYGEVDAVSHFTVGNYMAYTDKPIRTLPHYIDMRYGNDNKFMPHTLWYPPPYHVNFALVQIAGGERIVPIYLLNVIECTLFIIAIFFLVYKLFGFAPAIISSLLLMFSTRDINIYLWGQWPERMAFAYLPLILYCFYSYFMSKKQIYLYIMAILLAVNLFIHPMVLFHSAAALIVFAAFVIIKEKKLKLNLKYLIILVLIFLLIILMFPSQTGNVLFKTAGKETPDKGDLSRLFYWFKEPSFNHGLPSTHFGYANAHYGYWTLPLLFVGIFFLVFRRQKRDLLLLAWLVSLYIMLHLDVLGMGRSFRGLSGTAHIFYPLIAIGLYYLPSFLRIPNPYKTYSKYAFIAVFILLVVFINARQATPALKEAYAGIERITPSQYEASQWLMQNSNPEDNTNQIGTLTQAKSRWMAFLAHREISYYASLNNSRYFLLDYSDRVLIGDEDTVAKMQAFEKTIKGTLVYDKNYIRVYEVG